MGNRFEEVMPTGPRGVSQDPGWVGVLSSCGFPRHWSKQEIVADNSGKRYEYQSCNRYKLAEDGGGKRGSKETNTRAGERFAENSW